MRYWIFKCNPKKYRIDDRLCDPERRITWQVTRCKSEIGPGDMAFIWRTGSDRGVCAVMSVDTFPQELPELDFERPYCVDLDTGIVCRVQGELVKRFPCISHELLRFHPNLSDLPVFHGFQQATNFCVSHQQAQGLMEVIEEETS